MRQSSCFAWVTTAGGRLVVAPVPDMAFHERRIAFVYFGGQITELVELPRWASPAKKVALVYPGIQ